MARRWRIPGLGLVLVALTAVAGCGAGASSGAAKTASGAALSVATRTAPRSATGVPVAAPLPSLGAPPSASRSIVYTAGLTVRTGDVGGAAARAGVVAAGGGGYVFSSDVSVDPSSAAATSATVVLKVPPSSFAAVLQALTGLGTSLGVNQHAEDVTDQVVDVAARLRAQQASVARVEALLGQAKTIGDVVAVESELTKREADLESLEGRQRVLSAQVAMCTITLQLVARPVLATAVAGPGGFLAGLAGGWHALVRALVVGLTVVGALLPFAVALGVLVLAAVPLRRLLRTRRRTEPVTPVSR